MPELPQIINDVVFDFSWDERKVWGLDLPVSEMSVKELEWHFDVPFLWEHGEVYNLTPREVMAYPDKHAEEHQRTLSADMQYPIDFMENKGRWLILDGPHRLMRAFMQGKQTVIVRIVPREMIPKIKSVVVREFEGIDHLPVDPQQIQLKS